MSRGRSASKKRNVQGKSNHGVNLRQPCSYHPKGTCKRSSCEYWHPPQCQFYKTETGCKAGDKVMRKAATVRNTQITLSGKTPMGRRPRDLLDPASMNPEQLTSTPTKQDVLNEEIQKNGHEDSSWSSATRRYPSRSCWTNEVCSSDLRVGESVFIGKRIRAKSSKDGNPANGWRLKLLPSRALWKLFNTGSAIFQTNISKLRRPLDTVDLEELPDSRERTGAPVLWLSCERQADV